MSGHPSTFHGAFDDQAAQTPRKAASVAWFQGGRCCLSYDDLRIRSLALAHGIQRVLCSTQQAVHRPNAVLALQVPRVHADFVPLLLAASRCGLPFVLLSTDLPDKGLEAKRNSMILGHFQPVLLIMDAASQGAGSPTGDALAMSVEEVAATGDSPVPAAETRSNGDAAPACSTLCFMFTGGTQRTKAVEATHAMVLHERQAYKELWRPHHNPPVVLAHTSVYWGASALGQLSIALAFGGCVVWTEASEVADLRRCIDEELVTVLGVVPDHLDLLAPSDAATELPSVEVVFTWGERLPRRLAERWRAHPRAVLRELLIATEYWLCLWADPLGDGVLRSVNATELLVLTGDGRDAGQGELGELCIAGPMVMAGYDFRPTGLLEPVTEQVFYEEAVPSGGRPAPCRFFRTRDLVRRLPNGGLVYKGRADMMAKDKGKWVDMLAVEDALTQVKGIRAAKVLPDPVHEHYHAFVALSSSDGGEYSADLSNGWAQPNGWEQPTAAGALGATEVLDTARVVLPARTQLWQLPELPRHPVTRKVDVNRLKRLLSPGSSNYPLEGSGLACADGPGWAAAAAAAADAPWPLTGATTVELVERLSAKVWSQCAWTIAVAALTWAVADADALVAQAGAAIVMGLCANAVLALRSREECEATRHRSHALCSAAWGLVVVAISPPVSLDRVARVAGSFLSLTYSWLTLTYVDDARARSRAARWVMAVVDEVPFWKLGTLTLGVACCHLPGVFGVICSTLAVCSATSGFLLASWRQRTLAWPIVFWSMGIGHVSSNDCQRWLSLDFWRQQLPWQARRLWGRTGGAVVARLGGSLQLFSEQAGQPKMQEQSKVELPPAEFCARCSATLDPAIRWSAKDTSRQKVCDPCGALAAAEEARTALSWITIQFERKTNGLDHVNGVKRKRDVVDWHADSDDPVEARQPRAQKRSSEKQQQRQQQDQEQELRRGQQTTSWGDTGRTENNQQEQEVRPGPQEPKTTSWGDTERAENNQQDEQLPRWNHWWRSDNNWGWQRRNQRWDPEKYRSLNERWWYDCWLTKVEIPSKEASLQWDADVDGDASAACSAELLTVIALVEEVEPLLKPARPGTVLLGLDSLRVARLANAIRSRWAKALTAAEVRQARTVSDLAAAIQGAESVGHPNVEASMEGHGQIGPPGHADAPDAGAHREYAVWYSPGQNHAMGHWVLRTEEPIDHDACLVATRGVVERHAALRVSVTDPLRYSGFLYDCATLFTMYAPLLEAGPRMLRGLRRVMSSSLAAAWPRLRCYTREGMFGKAAPYEAVRVLDGQSGLERELGNARKNLHGPASITSFEMVCHLEDLWLFHHATYRGSFVILRCPEPAAGAASTAAAESADSPRCPRSAAASGRLLYVDVACKEWGVLVTPADDEWSTAPAFFPALYFVRMNTGSVAWLRLESANELRSCYRPHGEQTLHHLQAFRSAPRRDRTKCTPTVVSYIGFCMMHNWGDGNCYLPWTQDFLALYSAARKQRAGAAVAPLPPLPAAARVPFEELERRLFDTFHLRPSPMRSSIRGTIWRFKGRGYKHTLSLRGETMAAITKAALRYHVPLDIALLGLVACAMARADECEVVEFTLYAPMRDGVAEAMGLGLFSDWRDISVGVDFELATVLGTLMQLAHKIQHRQWTVYNALRKPERTVVNILPLDCAKRENFVNLSEHVLRGGDAFGKVYKRTDECDWARQPAVFNISQQDAGTWWINMEAALELRPPRWGRRFIAAFEQDARALVTNPLVPVHGRYLPSDAAILEGIDRAGGW